MGLSLEPVVMVMRGGNNHYKYGDPFDYSATILVAGPGVARILGFRLFKSNKKIGAIISSLCDELQKMDLSGNKELLNVLSELHKESKLDSELNNYSIQGILDDLKFELKKQPIKFHAIVWERFREDGTKKVIRVNID